jgi:hypothetical protein
MRTNKLLTIAAISLFAGLAGACASDSANSTNSASNAANASQVNTTMLENSVKNVNAANRAGNASHDGANDETPAAVKAVFPDAQSFTTQHKDVPEAAAASIEKDTGGKIPGRDHHSYLAFATKDGKRTQLGAATLVKAGGRDVIVVYESKEGMPTVREVRADGVAKEFLAQFAGVNHDAKIKFGEDIKAAGADEATARAIAQAVRIDVLTMEALYGAAHKH